MPKLSLGYSGIVLSSIKSNDSKPIIDISSMGNCECFWGLVTRIRIIRIIWARYIKRNKVDKNNSIIIPIGFFIVGSFYFKIHFYYKKNS